jgi:putative glutamine amidotransferase
MRLAVSMRVVGLSSGEEIRDALSHDWMRWLGERGHLVFPVPNVLDDPAGYLQAVNAEGLILTGGNDVIPFPGARDETAAVRTKTEHGLLAAAAGRHMPVLAVCRGLHVANNFWGGGMTADLRLGTGQRVEHVAHTHPVRLTGRFADVAGTDLLETNSFHKQGIRVGELARDFEAFAVSPADHVVEGAIHRELPLLAVQWHPERPNPAFAFDRILVDRLFTEGAFWR